MRHSGLKNLQTVMFDMHQAALSTDWHTLERLDKQRHEILVNMSQNKPTQSKENSDIISEIIQLDQAILTIINQSLKQSASDVKSARNRSLACQQYEAFSDASPFDSA